MVHVAIQGSSKIWNKNDMLNLTFGDEVRA